MTFSKYTSLLTCLSPLLVGALVSLRPCVGSLLHLLLSWLWMPGQVRGRSRAIRRLHSFATSLSLGYALVWILVYLGLRFSGLTRMDNVWTLDRSQTHATRVTASALGIPPWSPASDVFLHLLCGILAWFAYRHGEDEAVSATLERGRLLWSQVAKVSWLVLVASLPPSIPSALLYTLLVLATLLSDSGQRRPIASRGGATKETSGRVPRGVARRRLQAVVLTTALVLCALHTVASFVFQWAWIRSTPASESVCGQLFGLQVLQRERFVTARGAALVLLASWRLLSLREPMLETWKASGMGTPRAAAVLSFMVTMMLCSHWPGIFALVLAGLAELAVLLTGVSVWQTVMRILAAVATILIGLVAFILGIIATVAKRTVPTFWGLPLVGRSLLWNAWLVLCPLLWTQQRLPTEQKSNPLGRLLPSEYVPQYVAWLLLVGALAALVQDWLLGVLVAVLAIGVRTGKIRHLEAWVWLPLHGWAALIWSLRCGLCGFQSGILAESCIRSPQQCYVWVALAATTAAGWVFRVQPQVSADPERND
jgi:hypothetical protein